MVDVVNVLFCHDQSFGVCYGRQSGHCVQWVECSTSEYVWLLGQSPAGTTAAGSPLRGPLRTST